MKKLLSILSVGLLAMVTFSCVKEDLVTFDETQATAPVLGSYELGEKALTVAFTPGAFNTGFNQKMPVNHSLILASVDGKSVNKAVNASVKDGEISASITNLAKMLVSLGYSEGSVVTLEMFVRASMQDAARDNGRNGHVDSQGHITLSGFEVIIPVVQGNPWVDFTEKSPLGLIGSIASTGNGWNADEPMFMTQDGTRHVAKNIKLATGDAFKIRTAGSWDNIDLGGPGDVKPYVIEVGSAFEATAKGQDMSVPADGNYDILYDSNDGTITISEAYQTYPGYDQKSDWGITGSVASRGLNWDKDISMITDGEWHVAEGVELTTEDAFKFRTPGTWNEGDFGGPGDNKYVAAIDEEITGAEKGKDIAVAEAGVYDILFNPTAGLFKITPTLGGFSPLVGEGGSDTPEDDKPKVWSVIGHVGETSWDTDFDMTNTTGDIWVLKGQAFAAGDEFKIRYAHDWGGDLGGPEENAQSTINPDDVYGVYAPELGTAFEAGAKNIRIAEAGNYDITFDSAAKTIKVEIEVRADWYYHGQSEQTPNWGELPFEKVSDEEYVLTLTTVAENSGFVLKNGDESQWIGADKTQELTDGKFIVKIGEEFKISGDKVDGIIAEPGKYVFTFNPVAMTAVVKTLRADWYYHGQSEQTPDWGELPFEKVSDTEYRLNLKTVSENSGFVLKNGDESQWIGADKTQELTDGKFVVTIGEEFKISGDKVDGIIAKPGDYIFIFNPVDMTARIKNAREDWYYHGQSELTPDWGELPFEKVSDTEYVLKLKTVSENSGFVLKNGDESQWIGADKTQELTDGKFVVKVGEEFKISGDKVDGLIAVPGDYVLTFNPVAMTAVLNNARADWYYHGQSVATPDWGETPFVKVSDDEYYVILDVNDNSGFVLKNGDASQWIGAAASLKGEDGKYHVTPGMEFEISGDKVDGVIEKAGKYKMTFYPKEMKAVIATAEPEYYYHGQSKRTPNWGAIPFEKVSDEEYYVILEVEAGYGFVLKTADESSWFGAAASGKGEDGKYHVALGTEFSIDGDKVDAVFDAAGLVKLTYNPKTQKAVVTAL